MLKGLLGGLMTMAFLFAAQGLVYLGYGKKGMNARKDLNISSKGITLAWFFYLLILFLPALLVGLLESPLTALLIIIGGAIPYGLWVIHARRSVPELLRQAESLKKGMEKERSSFYTSREEEARKKAQLEAERAQREAEQARRDEEERRKLDALRQQLGQDGASEGLVGFVEVASNCKKIAEIRTAWNAWPKDGIDRPLQEEVKKRLDRLGSQEMIYGASERRTNELLNELRGLAGL